MKPFAFLTATALLAVTIGTAVSAQSPGPAQPSPSGSTEPVILVGPVGTGAAPVPPIGDPWMLTLDADSGQYWSEVAVCDGGFTLMAYGRDRKDRQRAQIWISADGITWTQGDTLRPAPGTDPYWLVTELVTFRGALYALGGDDRRLAVWRSPDCGRTWHRLRDPSFGLGRDACCISQGVEAAATGDRLLVRAQQGGEEIPRRTWAWVLEADGTWHRSPHGLEGRIDGAIGSTGTSFVAVRTETSPPGTRLLVVSTDGREWTTAGTLPRGGTPTWDGVGERFLAVSQDVYAEGPVSAVLWSSADGDSWSVLATAAPSGVRYGSVAAGEGVLVWIVDAGDGSGTAPWSWVGSSVDGGVTWSVSAGWAGLTLEGGKSVAITDDAVVIAGPGTDRTRVWRQAR